MNHDTRSTDAGYVYASQARLLPGPAAEHTRQTGCAPVFVFSQPVICDSQPDLRTIAVALQEKGLTGGTKIRTHSLLVLLSSAMSSQELLDYLLSEAENNDGLLFLEDIYRYGYDSRRAFNLLEGLVQAYRQPRPRCPLVLKAPPPSDRSLFRNCPGLQRYCFHLTDAPFIGDRRAPQQEPQQEPQREQVPPVPHPCHTGSAPANKQKPFPPKQGKPWHKLDRRLAEAEQNGLNRYLIKAGLAFELDTPTQLRFSRRLILRFRLFFRGLGPCDLAIVYANTFEKNDTGNVFIAFDSRAAGPLQDQLLAIKHHRDQELDCYLFQLPCDPRILENYGAAAAVLDGFIRAVM